MSKISLRKVADLIPFDRNARTHSPDQIDQLVASIREFGFTNPILVDPKGMVVAGHGRLEAARQAGLETVPTITVGENWTPEQLRAYVLADNQLALNAGWDVDLLKAEITSLQEIGFDVGSIGFDPPTLDVLFGEEPGAGEGVYSRKITPPIYEPKGDKPKPRELFDDEKTAGLIAEIKAAKVPKEIEAFLLRAAERHTVFNFARIADYYAMTTPEVQRLMEASALVIIDFNRAIECGFVKITQNLGELASKSERTS